MGEERNDTKLKQWHPMFLKSMRLALADAKPGQVEIQKEVPLSSKPLEIDIIVVKHNDDQKLHHPIARIFRKWNIIEFKSPPDYLAPYDFDTALVYARWHQVLENPKESLLDKYTITYVSSTFPRAMVKRLRERNLVIKESLPVPGIYRVEGEMYPIQIVVINELDDPKILWPFAAYLTGKNKGRKKAFVQLAAEQIKDPANQDARELMEFSVKNNLITAEELREVLKMGKQLTAKEKERFFEVFNSSPVTLEWKLKAEAKGKVEGKIEGIIEGKIEGKIEGIIEGKIEKSQEAICTYLNVRFGEDSLELQERVKQIVKLEILDKIMNKIYAANTLEDAQNVIESGIRIRG